MLSRRAKLVYLPAAIIAMAGTFWYWQSPPHVVAAAAKSLARAHTQQFAATITISNTASSEELAGPAADITLQVAGVFDRQDDARDSLAADIRLITATDSVTLTVEANTIFIADNAYVKIITTPPIYPALDELKGQWLVLPRGGTDSGPDIELAEPLFTDIKRVGLTKFTAHATPAAYVRLVDSIVDLLGTDLTTNQVDNILANLDQVNTLPVTIWVSPLGHDLEQLTATLAIPNQSTVELTLTFSDRNKPAEISVPDNAISLEQLLAPPEPNP